MRRQLLGLFFGGVDFLLAYGGWVAFYWIRRFYLYGQGSVSGTAWEYLWAPLLVGIYWTLLYGLGGSYKDPIRQSILAELFQRFWLTTLGSLALFFLAFIDDPIPNYKAYRLTLLSYVGLQTGLSWLSLVFLRLGLLRVLRQRIFRFPTIVVGSGSKAQALWENLTAQGEDLGYDLIGYVRADGDPNLLLGKAKCLGTLAELEQVLVRRGAHHVVIATDQADERILQAVLTQANGLPVEIHLLPALRDVLGGSVR